MFEKHATCFSNNMKAIFLTVWAGAFGPKGTMNQNLINREPVFEDLITSKKENYK